MPNVSEGTVQVRGGKVWYRVVGGETNGVPLLLLHGGPGVPHDYQENMEALADERPVVFYDQLGCGNSDRPEDPGLWTLERYVEELGMVRAALGLDRMHLLGQSWGCMLAVAYLLSERPTGVESLILSGPCLSASRFAADQRLLLSQMPDEVRKTIDACEASGDYDSPVYQEAVMAYYRRHVCRLDPWPESMMRSIKKMSLDVYRYMWGPSEFTLTGTLKEVDLEPRLGEIRCPTLLTCGRYDEATPETTALYRDMIPEAELVLFEDASHQHHLERPEAYHEAVRNFLVRLGR